MRLRWVTSEGFRCHQSLRWEPGPGINVLVGPNGSGKSSVLEAIGYLVTLRSFRGSPDASMVREGDPAAVVRGEFETLSSEHLVEAEIPIEGRRRVMLNGKSVRSRKVIAEALALVTFLPDDIDIVKRAPGLRREVIDEAAAQLWPAAIVEQRSYERVLRQRNALLRAEGRSAPAAEMDAIDALVAQHGATLVSRRLHAMRVLSEPLTAVHDALGGDPIAWSYDTAGIEEEADVEAEVTRDRLEAALKERRRGDMERRLTTVGPHRDDITLRIGARDVRTRASQGEQRSVALALRVAVYRCLSERRGERPLLILDDVFSELDRDRAERLVEQLPDGQVLVTAARPEELPVTGQRWVVHHGGVSAA